MRSETVINKNWSFHPADVGLEKALESTGQAVAIPHTWNGKDGQDGGNDYYRGICWYTRQLKSSEIDHKARIYLEFCGVNSSAKVYFNGELLGSHDGGYSTFRFEITGRLEESNSIAVEVDNGANERVYPQTADFTFYGGIYRDVKVVSLPQDHIALGEYGSYGVRATPRVEAGTGFLDVDARVVGDIPAHVFLYDAEGVLAADGELGSTLTLPDVRLWQGVDDPYLYTLRVQLVDDNTVIDEVSTKIGFRTFFIDPVEGFFLNGKKYPLRGVSRHQDRPEIGNALSREHHEEDIAIIREIGANTLRLAHYQHDDYVYELCDQAGLVVWAEIPYISRHMPSANDNARSQMKELILQQFNHPSIICWGLSNEISMYRAGKDRLEFHRELNNLCHDLDPSRKTVIAAYVTKMNINPLNRVPDLLSYNLYYGWYFPFTWLTGVKLDLHHFMYPKERIGLAEYGAEGMPNLHSALPIRGDNSEEYQALYHERMIKLINKRDYLWATHLWNMFDFAADARDQGGEAGMNHKGLVSFDRKTRKDAFYVYKAYWSDDPFVHICSKRFERRTGRSIMIKICSNQPEIEVLINGESFAKLEGKQVFRCRIPLKAETRVTVRSGKIQDTATFRRVSKKEAAYSLRRSGTKSWQHKH